MERTELARLLGAARMSGEPHDVVIEEPDPARWRAAFAAAVASGGTVFLANPAWGAAERVQFDALVELHPQRPTLNIQRSTLSGQATEQIKQDAVGGGRANSALHNPQSAFSQGWLCIPTGGSGGQLKLARHDQQTLHAAVGGFADHFGVSRVNAVGVLPLHHVGGLMGWLRCALTGGKFVDLDWKVLEEGGMSALPETPEGWFISLVPTQLQRLLARPMAVEWLRRFSAVLVGGGPLWAELADAAAREGVPLAPTYGSTETVAAVAALRPEVFLSGGRGCGSALPHTRVTLDTEGAIVVEGASLFRGYWPAGREPGAWVTDDRGRLDERGSLLVLGRNDAMILTGGEKVEPAEVEAVLRATGEFADVAVVGVPDPAWGSAVVVCYPGGGREPDPARLAAALSALAAFKRPKRLVALPDWPRDAAGKIDRAKLVRLVGVQSEERP